jgi:hypothetical protein
VAWPGLSETAVITTLALDTLCLYVHEILSIVVDMLQI